MSRVKPFLKWAGGKRQLLRELRPFYPTEFNAYWEPFAGSGAVFFDLWSQGLLAGRPAHLIDTNKDLIVCYRTVRDDVEGLIRLLGSLQRRHARDAQRTFDTVRRDFNTRRLEVLDSTVQQGDIEHASMLIYLNRTGFNGLFRLNARGAFNVPLGRYAHPVICDGDNLRAVSRILNEPLVETHCGSFETVLQSAAPGDFIYFDPPYAPLSATSNFRSYTAEGFSSADQKRLQEAVITLARRGCRVLLSNSSAPEIEQLYGDNTEARRAGLRFTRVKARRAINSKASSRGAIDEVIVTNR